MIFKSCPKLSGPQNKRKTSTRQSYFLIFDCSVVRGPEWRPSWRSGRRYSEALFVTAHGIAVHVKAGDWRVTPRRHHAPLARRASARSPYSRTGERLTTPVRGCGRHPKGGKQVTLCIHYMDTEMADHSAMPLLLMQLHADTAIAKLVETSSTPEQELGRRLTMRSSAQHKAYTVRQHPYQKTPN